MVLAYRKFLLCLCCGFVYLAAPSLAQEQPAKALEQLDFANGLFARGLYDLAATEYQKYIEDYKEGEYLSEAYLGIGECHFFKNAYPQAAEAYRTFLSRFPNDYKRHIVYIRLGQIHLLDKQYQAAADSFAKVQEDQLPFALTQSYQFYAGQSFAGLDQLDAAEGFLKKAASHEAGEYTSQSHLFLGDVYLKKNQLAEALAAYEKAHELAPDDEVRQWALFKKGEAQFSAQQYEEAIQTFKDITSKYPGQPLAQQAALNLMSASFNAGRFGDVQNTFSLFKEKAEKSKEDFQAYYVMANALIRLSQFAQALETINQALQLPQLDKEQLSMALAKRAEILIKTKEYQKALEMVQQELAPVVQKTDELLFLEAESYYGLEQFQTALSAYEKIISDHPQSAFLQEAIWGRALCLKTLGQTEQALSLLLNFYETAPREPLKEHALYNAFLLQAQTDEITKAFELGRAYMEKYPAGEHLEKVFYLLGHVYTKSNDLGAAADMYQQYLKQFPDSTRVSEVKFLLGYSQQASGRWEDALKTYASISLEQSGEKQYYSSLKNSVGIFIEQDDPQKAFEFLRKILSEFKENDLTVATFIWLAQQLIDKEKYQEGLQALEQIPLEKATAKEKAAIAYFKAEAFYGMNEHQKAIEQYDVAISSPDSDEYSAAAKVKKASSLQAAENYDEAEKALEEIVEANPQDNTVSIHARFQLGELEELQGNLEAAVKYYLLVAVLYDDEQLVPKALYKAGELLEKQNKQREALKTYEELVERFQNNELAQKAGERIQAIRQ
ncbi:MAG TPA: tetratricopeptide repeat protein [Candidatus Omnitrophota bacterium]|nr:tetratricopeptide repeat protein [Candidatus Omnitrophota bacterium]